MKLSSIKELADLIESKLTENDQSLSVVSSLLHSEKLQEILPEDKVSLCSWNDIIETYTAETDTGAVLPKADVYLMIFSLEYIKEFQRFLLDVCQSSGKQIIIVCRPFDKEDDPYDRWLMRRFILDFTEDFLVKEMHERNFVLNSAEKIDLKPYTYVYEFRKI